MTAHEKAQATYEALKKRKAAKDKNTQQNYLGHVISNIDKTCNKNYKNRKRIGQL